MIRVPFPRWSAAAIVLGLGLLAAPPATAATTTPSPGATQAAQGIALVPVPAVAKPGTRVLVRSTGWPASIGVQVALCGNLALNGTSDCYSAGAASAATDAKGSFTAYVTAGTPPVPCPCVMFANSFSVPQTAKQAFTLTGADTAAPSTSTSTRSVDLGVRISGANIATWFGGAAKRTVTLTVKNTGSAPLNNPNLTITAGKGSDPTALLAQPQIGAIAAGQTVQYSVPFTLKAPAFGEYRVKAQISGLDQLATATATTSAYPYALIVLAWLLVQPLLLGLYKRRPTAEDGPGDDPFAIGPATPAPAYATAADDLFAWDAAPVALAAPALVGGHYGEPAGHAAYSSVVVPRPPSPLIPNYRPVFGVSDLRAYLDPGSTAPQQTSAPRIVLGGIVPRHNGHDPDTGLAHPAT